MSKVIINANIYTGQRKIKHAFLRYNEKIIKIGKMEDFRGNNEDKVLDAEDQFIIPGFIDVHSHGGYGIDNMDGDPNQINELTTQLLGEGVTTYFPTTMTQSKEAIDKSLKAIKEASKTNDMIKGIHLEGPFISKDYKGAQDEEHIIVPSKEQMEKWYEISGDLIKLVTYAPEVSADISEFEDYCKKKGIILSAGHSGALYEDLTNSKASHVTHLFNAQRGLHHREPGVSGYGLLNEGVYVELIVDGFHVLKEMVKLVYKVKGAEGILLITDSMRAKGLGEGISELGGQKVIVENKEARLENGALAGSVLTFIDAFRNIINYTNCSIEEAVTMSSVNQADEFQLEDKGKLLPNYDADFLILNNDLSIEKTFLGGIEYDANEKNK